MAKNPRQPKTFAIGNGKSERIRTTGKFSGFYEIMAKKVTFASFRVAMRPRLDPPLLCKELFCKKLFTAGLVSRKLYTIDCVLSSLRIISRLSRKFLN